MRGETHNHKFCLLPFGANQKQENEVKEEHHVENTSGRNVRDNMEGVRLKMRTFEPTGEETLPPVFVCDCLSLEVTGRLRSLAAAAAAAGVKTDSCQWHLFNDLYTD